MRYGSLIFTTFVGEWFEIISQRYIMQIYFISLLYSSSQCTITSTMTEFVYTPNEKNYIFYPARNEKFVFRISCTNDCFVALTTQPQVSDPNYEIVIGGFSNTRSIIRKIDASTYLASVPTPGIVNNNELRGFWVHWHDKTISVGREGENVPFMSHKDSNIFAVKYVGICTAYGSTGSWMFDNPIFNEPNQHKLVATSLDISKNLRFFNTPDEYKFKFIPTRGNMLKFKVRCSTDCSLLLTSQPGEQHPRYEIVIGAWSNTKSTIFRDKSKLFDIVVSTPSIVSANEFRGFWVIWQGNIIRVGREGEHIPFMSYADKFMFAVEYVGIATAYGSNGSWFIDESAAETPSSSNVVAPAPIHIVPMSKTLTSFHTPNEYKFRFFPARGNIFQFKVRCSTDCSLLLSSKPQAYLPRYEIVIGAWSNTKSTIFRDKSKLFDVIVSTPSIVSADEFRGFWVSWQENIIRVGREGEHIPFMSYVDPNFFTVKYVGIATAYGSDGSWLIDESASIGVASVPLMTVKAKTHKEKSYKYYPASDDIFTFKICCSHDCHLALSAQPLEGLPMYEIVIGGWGNTKSVIRQIGTEPSEVAESTTPDIVSGEEMRGFWIRWQHKVISVGREGEDNSFMSHKDMNLFPIKYVGISTGYGATGSWYFEDATANCTY